MIRPEVSRAAAIRGRNEAPLGCGVCVFLALQQIDGLARRSQLQELHEAIEPVRRIVVDDAPRRVLPLLPLFRQLQPIA